MSQAECGLRRMHDAGLPFRERSPTPALPQ